MTNEGPSKVLTVLGYWLDTLFDAKPKSQQTPKEPTYFHASALPRTSPAQYLQRFSKLTTNESTWIVALIYLNRVNAIETFQSNHFTIHRLLLACIDVATKYLDENRYSQKYFSKVGGLPKGAQEMNRLEFDLLQLLKFDCFVTRVEYNDFLSSAFLAASLKCDRVGHSIRLASNEGWLEPLEIETVDLLEESKRSNDEGLLSNNADDLDISSYGSQIDAEVAMSVRVLELDRTLRGCRSPRHTSHIGTADEKMVPSSFSRPLTILVTAE